MKKDALSKMNLANKITVFRILCVPFFVCSIYGSSNLAPVLIFSVASFTDFLDGFIARKYNMITNTGKFMDAIADKILVLSAFIMLVFKNAFSPVFCIIIMAREFIVSAVRMLAASKGCRVISANVWGKLKTVIQMITIVCLLLSMPEKLKKQGRLCTALSWISVIVTVLSCLSYLRDNRDLLEEE